MKRRTSALSLLTFTVLALFLPREARAVEADRPAQHAAYAEGGGPGGLASINYEHHLSTSFAFRFGLGTLGISSKNVFEEPTLPVTVSFTGIRAGKTGLELGAGGSMVFVPIARPYGAAFAGLRVHPIGRVGFQFRAGGMLLAGDGGMIARRAQYQFMIQPWIYFSFGLGF